MLYSSHFSRRNNWTYVPLWIAMGHTKTMTGKSSASWLAHRSGVSRIPYSNRALWGVFGSRGSAPFTYLDQCAVALLQCLLKSLMGSDSESTKSRADVPASVMADVPASANDVSSKMLALVTNSEELVLGCIKADFASDHLCCSIFRDLRLCNSAPLHME